MACYRTSGTKPKLAETTAYVMTVAEIGTDRVAISLRDPDRDTEMRIETGPQVLLHTADATLTRSENGSKGTIPIRLGMIRNPETDSRLVTLSDETDQTFAEIECDLEEWRNLAVSMLHLLNLEQQREDTSKLATPTLTDPESIRSRVHECIHESQQANGQEVDCLNVRLDDARRALEENGTKSEGGSFLGSGIYDLDVLNGDRIEARLRVRL